MIGLVGVAVVLSLAYGFARARLDRYKRMLRAQRRAARALDDIERRA